MEIGKIQERPVLQLCSLFNLLYFDLSMAQIPPDI